MEPNEQFKSINIQFAINIIYTHILRVVFVFFLYFPITEHNNYPGCQLQLQIRISESVSTFPW